MDWNQLKENCCPRCGKRLKFPDQVESSLYGQTNVTCSGSHCLFKINESKFNQIVRSQKNREVYDPDYNQAALNNFY
jgi:hypothetical protein